MNFIEQKKADGIATITLNRGKVNALNDAVINELRDCLKLLEVDKEINSIILTGKSSFFSFGFDVPEFLSFTKQEFTDYLINFSSLYTYLFLYPKPVIAALNGHTIAGGCMLVLACDSRVMVTGKAKISLNEIAFGSSVFAGSTEMLRFLVGSQNATEILYSGAMYSAEEALRLDLVQELAIKDNLINQARTIASDLGSKHQPAFASIKTLLRKPVADDMVMREEESIREFVDIWYSESTWENLKNIKIQ